MNKWNNKFRYQVASCWLFILSLNVLFALGEAITRNTVLWPIFMELRGDKHGQTNNMNLGLYWSLFRGHLAGARQCKAVKVGRVGRSQRYFSYCSNNLTNREEEGRKRLDRKRGEKYVTHFYKYNVTAVLLLSGTLRSSVVTALLGRSPGRHV